MAFIKNLLLQANTQNEDWINTINNDNDNDNDEDEDSFEYLYPTKSNKQLSNDLNDSTVTELKSLKPTNRNVSSPKIKIVNVGFIENSISQRQQSGATTSTTPSSPKLVRSPSRKDNNYTKSKSKSKSPVNLSPPPPYVSTTGYPFIKRGKFKGFYDDRKYRCIYSNFKPTFKCDHPNCYCIFTPIVSSPLKNQMSNHTYWNSELLSDDEEEEESDSTTNNDKNDINTTSDEENKRVVDIDGNKNQKQSSASSAASGSSRVSDNISFSSQFRNRYGLSRVKQKFGTISNDESTITTTINSINHNDVIGINDSSVSEKLTKRMKKYHSVNNLAKKASLKHQLIAKSDQQKQESEQAQYSEHSEVPTTTNRPTSSRPGSHHYHQHHKHHYLKTTFRSLDIGFYKPVTTT